jgi:phage terminase large subunit-like protein
VPEWSTACPDWSRRIVAGESLIPFAPLFPEQADAAMRIYRELVVVDQPSVEAADGSIIRPTFGTLSREWILEFVSHIFGSYDAESGRRLITEFYLSISKKNAKSTAGAGIMLTALILNWRQSGEFSIISPTIEIANNSFFPARDMIRADPELRDLLLVQEHYRTITHRVSNATLKVVAADNEAVGGKKSIGTLIDELWIFGKRPNAENMLREATGGQASRPEGFTVYLTTQSDEPPAGVFKQKLSYARGVRDGRIADKRFLPLLYEFPEAMIKDESYLDRKNFYITNPNLGASVDPEFLDRRLAEAQESGEESVRGFLAKHLNIEIGLALQSGSWAGAMFWEENSERALTLEEILRRCEVVSVGIDGGGLDDMLGLSAIGREKGTGLWLHWAHAWIHPIVLERRKKEAARFRDFEADGDLTIVDKIGDDLAQVAQRIQQIEEAGLLERVGVDVAGIGGVVDALVSPKPKGIGLAQDRIVGIPQGWKMVGAIKTLERKLAEKMVKHAGSNLMAWVIGNAKVEPRGNAIVITKQLAGSAKIDPLMATFNAVTLMALNPQATRRKLMMFSVG